MCCSVGYCNWLIHSPQLTSYMEGAGTDMNQALQHTSSVLQCVAVWAIVIDSFILRNLPTTKSVQVQTWIKHCNTLLACYSVAVCSSVSHCNWFIHSPQLTNCAMCAGTAITRANSIVCGCVCACVRVCVRVCGCVCFCMQNAMGWR